MPDWSIDSGRKIIAATGNKDPTEKARADATAARTGFAEVCSEIPISSLAWASRALCAVSC